VSGIRALIVVVIPNYLADTKRINEMGNFEGKSRFFGIFDRKFTFISFLLLFPVKALTILLNIVTMSTAPSGRLRSVSYAYKAVCLLLLPHWNIVFINFASSVHKFCLYPLLMSAIQLFIFPLRTRGRRSVSYHLEYSCGGLFFWIPICTRLSNQKIRMD
jgi:hypothetical protein